MTFPLGIIQSTSMPDNVLTIYHRLVIYQHYEVQFVNEERGKIFVLLSFVLSNVVMMTPKELVGRIKMKLFNGG